MKSDRFDGDPSSLERRVRKMALLNPNEYYTGSDVETRSSYWVARLLMLRLLGVVLFFVFLSHAFQNKALFGPKGVDPAEAYLRDRHTGAPLDGRPRPKLVFDLLGFGDWQLDVVAWSGVFLSLVLASGTVNSAIVPGALWVFQVSLLNLKARALLEQPWEWQLCETTLLCIFLCPLADLTAFPEHTPPPKIVLWVFRVLSFRLALGAGVAGLGEAPPPSVLYRQPLPAPLAYFALLTGPGRAAAAALLQHRLELALCWLFLVPHRAAQVGAGSALILLQACGAALGNNAANWLSVVPFLASLDDDFLLRFCPDLRQLVSEAEKAARPMAAKGAKHLWRVIQRRGQMGLYIALAAFLSFHSFPALRALNPFHPEPPEAPQYSFFFDPFFFVNHYAPTYIPPRENRYQIVLWYTHEDPQTAMTWHELDFKCLPGSLERAPCWVGVPYVPRLDWVVWRESSARLDSLAGYEMIETAHWFPDTLQKACLKMLKGDTEVAGLFGTPLRALYGAALDSPPQAVRAELYQYAFTDEADTFQHPEAWWKRVVVPDHHYSVTLLGGPDQWSFLQLPFDLANNASTCEGHGWLLLAALAGAWYAVHGVLSPQRAVRAHTSGGGWDEAASRQVSVLYLELPGLRLFKAALGALDARLAASPRGEPSGAMRLLHKAVAALESIPAYAGVYNNPAAQLLRGGYYLLLFAAVYSQWYGAALSLCVLNLGHTVFRASQVLTGQGRDGPRLVTGTSMLDLAVTVTMFRTLPGGEKLLALIA